VVCKTISIVIQCPPARVYEFAHDPENLPKWASAFCLSVRQSDSGWIIETPQGPVGIRFAAKNEFGVLDHWVTPASGVEIYVPMRVVSNGNGSEVIFTLIQSPDMSDAAFAADATMVEQDLGTLKRVLEK
jgi:hypothetical protein